MGKGLQMVATMIVGILVGIGATAVYVAARDDDDPVDLACAAIGDVDVDDAVEDGLGEDLYLITGAGSLFLAAADGDEDSSLGGRGRDLQSVVARFDTDLLTEVVTDAQEYCDQR